MHKADIILFSFAMLMTHTHLFFIHNLINLFHSASYRLNGLSTWQCINYVSMLPVCVRQIFLEQFSWLLLFFHFLSPKKLNISLNGVVVCKEINTAHCFMYMIHTRQGSCTKVLMVSSLLFNGSRCCSSQRNFIEPQLPSAWSINF